MKIGVQARLLAEPYTGVGSYTEHLFTKLAQDHPEDEYTLFTYKKVTTTFPKNIKIKVIPEKKWLLLASLKKGYWERFQVPKFFKNFDIIHHTYPNLAPGGIVTIHDVIPWKNKKYRASLRSKTYFHLVKKALKKADKILAVSQTTKKEAVKYLGLSPKKITVTYEAADPEYLRPANKNPIDPPYLLYVGGYDERKNIDYLIEVFSKTKHPNLKLVLAGGKVKNTSLYDSHNLQKSSKNDKINLLKTGFVSIEELNALYRGAQALINLSKEEGFNLPILEAAYAKTPAITSDIEVHRELYGNKVLLLTLNDPEKAAENLRKFLENKPMQQKLAATTKELREKYTWEKTAKAVRIAYGG